MELDNILIKILGIESSWELKKVEVIHVADVVRIEIDYLRNTQFPCPHCGKEGKVNDGSYREWRHLDFMQYKTYLNVKIPRINCKECGILALKEMPFGRMGSHYSFFLND